MEAAGRAGEVADMNSALLQCCEAGEIEKARDLISKGADVNCQTSYNSSEMVFVLTMKANKDRGLVWYCVEVDRLKLSTFLKDKELDSFSNPESYGIVLKRGPGLHPDREAMKEIEEMKQRLSRKWVQRDMTPLHLAVCNGEAAMAEMLLDGKADPCKQDRFEHTAVELAASKGDISVMDVFQKKGLLTDLDDLKKIAQDNGHRELVKYLRDQSLYQWAQMFRSKPITDVAVQFTSLLAQAAPELFSAKGNMVEALKSGIDEPSTEQYQAFGREVLKRKRHMAKVLKDFVMMVEKKEKRLTDEENKDNERVRPNLAETTTNQLSLSRN